MFANENSINNLESLVKEVKSNHPALHANTDTHTHGTKHDGLILLLIHAGLCTRTPHRKPDKRVCNHRSSHSLIGDTHLPNAEKMDFQTYRELSVQALS